MHECTISENLALPDGGSLGSAAAGTGFGLVNLSDARLFNSTISGNEGGGVYNDVTPTGGGKGSSTTPATLAMTGCTVSDNLRPDDGGTGPFELGFGVINLGNATITNSTFKGNDTGGVYNGPSSGGAKGSTGPALTMVNCSVSEHHALAGVNNSGAGVVSAGTIAIIHCTISGNDIGVYNFGGTAVLKNTIAAGNATEDLQGAGFSGSNNLLGTLFNGDAETEMQSDASNILGVATADLLIEPLGNNGGPTQTMALLAGSPAIN